LDNDHPRSIGKTLLMICLPLILLGGVIAVFLVTNGAGLKVEPAAPIENLAFERTVLKPHLIQLFVRNVSPQPLTLSALNINDAIWPFKVEPQATLPRLGRAVVTLDYDWLPAEAYRISLFSANAIAFDTEIAVASETPEASAKTFWSFSLIGLYVGVIPVFLGIFWLPALRRLGPAAFIFLMALTAGMLMYLGIDATQEAFELREDIGDAFQGAGLIGIGIVGTFFLLQAISQRQARVGRSEAEQRLSLALLISTGIGLHNFGEGLAIGAAYSVGAAALGAFLVIGFIVQNVTEGLGIIAPILRDRAPIAKLALMGAIAGLPANLGCYLGGFNYFKPLAVLFFAIGAGAVFQVAWEIGKLIRKDMAKAPRPIAAFSGMLAGMVALWLTGLFIK
jgi:zinc transporter, ZIP family